MSIGMISGGGMGFMEKNGMEEVMRSGCRDEKEALRVFAREMERAMMKPVLEKMMKGDVWGKMEMGVGGSDGMKDLASELLIESLSGEEGIFGFSEQFRQTEVK